MKNRYSTQVNNVPILSIFSYKGSSPYTKSNLPVCREKKIEYIVLPGTGPAIKKYQLMDKSPCI
jgi:hypothetical protein